jgi:hypothetical protein
MLLLASHGHEPDIIWIFDTTVSVAFWGENRKLGIALQALGPRVP